MSDIEDITAEQWLSSLVLGTAQFGFDYGVTNRKGMVPPEIAKSILLEAHSSGIKTLDTAAAYGDSEKVLGRILAETGLAFSITTKVGSGPGNRLNEEFENSLQNLRVSRVSVLMLHNSERLREQRVVDFMASMKSSGKIGGVGVSVYFPHEVELLLNQGMECDVVQIPYNVLDRRFDAILPVMRENGIEVHARSVFLQGLLLADERSLDRKFEWAIPAMRGLNELSKRTAVPRQALLLNFVMAKVLPGRPLFGVTSVEEFRENVAGYQYWRRSLDVLGEMERFALSDESLLIPTNWQKL